MAIQQQDFNAMIKDIMGAFPVDTKAFDQSFKTSATLNEKLSNVAIEAAGRSTELSSKWTKDTLARVADLSKAKAEPADYAKAMSDFATYQAETASEHMNAFAEIVKKAQADTVELMMAAGKDYGDEFNASIKKAQTAAKKTTK
ncbi:phasin family protein [Litorisediminicola beolgyonensis]|uniref:Phasin family protein n=1 Tax=Litorisediminicola beolgyonensis TaxID=1173614 RepID=A0ABW3ZI98_9RHOB